MTDWSHRTTAKHLCCFLFACSGSIWRSVFPYCIINCGIMALVEWLAMNDVHIAFSIQGHSLMTLIISYLVVAKINLSYERYMKARFAIANALSSLRELNQLSLAYSVNGGHRPAGKYSSSKSAEDLKVEEAKYRTAVREWRCALTDRIVDLMECTIRVIRDERQSKFLARNEFDIETDADSNSYNKKQDGGEDSKILPFDDPLLHVQAMRMHLYQNPYFQLLEKIKLVDVLDDYVNHYRQLLALASTPLPFPLVQMARTFLFLWTFTIPFVLRGVIEEAKVAMVFVFFLTYGFIGLELVSLKLVHPFGDGRNDLNITGMKYATLKGMERDLEMVGQTTSLVGNRRVDFSRQRIRRPKPVVLLDVEAQTEQIGNRTRRRNSGSEGSSGNSMAGLGGATVYDEGDDHHPTDHMYVAMHSV